MKKLYLLSGIAFMALFFTSCTKEYIQPAPASETVTVSIPSQGWRTSDGVTYSATISVPEITPYINEAGTVLVYLSFGGGSYEQIPEVSDNISYSFSHSPGYLTIYAQDLSGNDIVPPSNTNVKINLSGY